MAERHAMTKDELRELMRETVRESLLQLGIENSSPMDMQRDFQFLRKWRKGVESVSKAAIVAAVTTVVGAVFGLIWLGMKLKFLKGA